MVRGQDLEAATVNPPVVAGDISTCRHLTIITTSLLPMMQAQKLSKSLKSDSARRPARRRRYAASPFASTSGFG